MVERLEIGVARLGEGPCWHESEGVLYWVDIMGHVVHRYDPRTGEDRTVDVGEPVGTVAPRASGGLLLGLVNGLAFLDLDTGRLDRLPAIDDRPETRFNDGKCDPQGRFWVGTMDRETEDRPLGNLYRMDPDLSVHLMETSVTISNGMGWSPDERTFYYADSPTRCVFAYDFERTTGAIENRRVVIRLKDGEGFPDGLTTDAEGMIWLAQWGGSCVTRRNPATGGILETVPTEAPHTSACCFGGVDRRDLYITSAREGRTEEELKKELESGALYRWRAGVTGALTHPFAG
ncbi:MAG: SMP-30/gluconolactonase/LRE family protein [Verrucomicrobiota bacterium]